MGNFCEVTGQSNWCDSGNMRCHDNSNENCKVQNWCVCQWAFASYIQNAGGCDAIQDIVCQSINMVALNAYRVAKENNGKYDEALSCIVQRCGLDLSNTSVYS